jgi:hypothetical protein
VSPGLLRRAGPSVFITHRASLSVFALRPHARGWRPVVQIPHEVTAKTWGLWQFPSSLSQPFVAIDNWLIRAPFLARGLLTVGSRVRHARLDLRTDLSSGAYIYAFPAQQVAFTEWAEVDPAGRVRGAAGGLRVAACGVSLVPSGEESSLADGAAPMREREPSPVS